MLDEHLRQYLGAVGIVDGITAHAPPCEICGSEAVRPMVEWVRADAGVQRRLPVVGCERCGFLFQSPRFDRRFYDIYYQRHYRKTLFGSTQPARDFVRDQMLRGEHLRRSLGSRLPAGGCLLDVGCSAGGLMLPFIRHGWSAHGTDPDEGYVEYGRRHLGLSIHQVAAEDMELPAQQYDLVIINGSLEHVFDANRVLRLCRAASKPGALLLIEGRALGYGVLQGFFSHHHRRYLSAFSTELLMLKHGWQPLLSTAEPLCGPTRPGAVFVLGKAAQPLGEQGLLREIEAGRRDDLLQLQSRLASIEGAARW